MLNYKTVTVAFSLCAALVSCNQKSEKLSINQEHELAEIDRIMNVQAEAWNQGNIEDYMAGYWKNDSLIFTGGKKLTMGWQQATDRYRKSYPNKGAMGHLDFTEVETSLTSDNSAFSVGSWHVRTDSNLFEGRFTLVWKKINNQWFIIADHSS